MIRVLLIEDHHLVRRGLHLLLERNPDVQVIGEAATGAQAVQLALELKPELLLVDMHLPDLDGVEVVRRVLAELPMTKPILITGDVNMSWVDSAIEAGVCGFLLKTADEEELAGAIRHVMKGRLYLCPEVGTRVVEGYRKALPQPNAPEVPTLSSQELRVLKLTTEGMRLKEIASQLNVGVKTAETYRRRIMQKLGCDSTAELVRFAIRQGLVQP